MREFRWAVGCATLVAAFLHAEPASANVVWPALVIQMKYYAPLPIISGLIVEFLFLIWYCGMPWKKAVVADLAMNAVSAITGFLLVPLVGAIWSMTGDELLQYLFRALFDAWGRPLREALELLVAGGVNATLEGWTVRLGFQRKFHWQHFLALTGANVISVAIALHWGRHLAI